MISYIDQTICRDAFAYGTVRDACYVEQEKYYLVSTTDHALENCGIEKIADDESGFGIGIFHPDELEPYRRLIDLIVNNEGIA